MMKVVVVNSSLKERHRDMIEQAVESAGGKVCFTESEDSIPEEFAKPDVVYGFGMKTAATDSDLKWLCVPSAGVDFLMKDGLFANKDCMVTYSSGAYGVSIAEHIIGVSLMMMRGLTTQYALSLNGKWGKPIPQRSLKGSRITVLGTGDIGRCFAKRVRAFEPENIIGVSRSGKCEEDLFDRMIKTDEMDEVLCSTDLLVMSLPDTPETRGILSKKRLDLLPDDAFVVNVGRGSAIDEDALADSLNAGKLGGAALDVFSSEPLPDTSRLWTAKNILITPHIAGNLTLDHTIDKNVEMFCEDLKNYAQGLPLRHLLDRNKGY